MKRIVLAAAIATLAAVGVAAGPASQAFCGYLRRDVPSVTRPTENAEVNYRSKNFGKMGRQKCR